MKSQLLGFSSGLRSKIAGAEFNEARQYGNWVSSRGGNYSKPWVTLFSYERSELENKKYSCGVLKAQRVTRASSDIPLSRTE